MAAWRYETSLLVLKKYFTSEHSEQVKYFSTLEEKLRISAQPCNIPYVTHTAHDMYDVQVITEVDMDHITKETSLTLSKQWVVLHPL